MTAHRSRPTAHGPRLAAATLAAAAVLGAAAAGAAPIRGLTSATGVARLYDTILDADFDAVPGAIQATCPPAPAEACGVMEPVATWWRIQLDPLDRSRDPVFLDQVARAIAAAEAWTVREPERAEAWFYLAGAYGARAQWRVLRTERLAAARDGKRIKEALERALALDPGMADAWFGIGLYQYYADIAPTVAKLFRWIFALPGGDKVEGLRQMRRARDEGRLVHGEADYQLHVIDLWYEKKFDDALVRLQDLGARYPANPLFPQLVAEVQDVYFHDATASLRSWRALVDRARQGRVHEPQIAETRARIGMSVQLDRLCETDAAIEQLRLVVASAPAAPYGARAQAELQLGLGLARMGDRAGATAALQRAIATAPADDPLGTRDRARAAQRTPVDAPTAEAYRLSIVGWRALQRGALDAAARALDRSLAIRPDDAVSRWRHGRLLAARGDEAGALADYERVILARPSAAPTFLAEAYVDAARLLETRDRARAIGYLRAARLVWSADQRTKDAAERELARMGRTGE